MSSITKQTVGNNTYLYESHSFRDEQGRPRNRKVKIGKVDSNTGRARYTPEYIDRMREAGTPVEIPQTVRTEGLEEQIGEALDSLKTYGLFYSAKPIRSNTPRLAAAVRRQCFWSYRDRKYSNFCGRPERA